MEFCTTGRQKPVFPSLVAAAQGGERVVITNGMENTAVRTRALPQAWRDRLRQTERGTSSSRD